MNLVLGTIAITGLIASAGNVVQVSDTASLYSAVNDPANAGKTVHLKAGTYALNTNSPLVLQPGMSLEGETVLVDTDADGLPDAGGASQSVIDGSAVSGSAKSMIEAGAGKRIANLTIVGTGVAGSVGAAISTLSASADVDLDVVNCWIKGAGRRGIRFGRAAGADGSQNRGRAQGNLITGVVAAVQFIFVGQIAGASWTGVVRGNHLKGNNNGLIIERNTLAAQTAGNSYDISSEMNLYEKNAWGIFMPYLVGSFEQTRIRSVQDTIVDSSPARGIVPNTTSGGIGAGLDEGTNCYTRIEILNTSFTNNIGPLGPLDFALQPDSPTSVAPQSSTNNVFELLIRGVNASGVAGSWKVIPSSPVLGNEVRLIGSDVALENSNESLPITFIDTF